MTTTTVRDVFDPIIEAFTDARTRLEPRARLLTERIYAGDRAALDEAHALMDAADALADHVTRLAGDDPHNEVDSITLHRALGMYDMATAVLVAFGEEHCDDEAVLERWRPLRLERAAAQLEMWIARVDDMEADGTLTGDAEALRTDARGRLALIAAGIEPDDD